MKFRSVLFGCALLLVTTSLSSCAKLFGGKGEKIITVEVEKKTNPSGGGGGGSGSTPAPSPPGLGQPGGPGWQGPGWGSAPGGGAGGGHGGGFDPGIPSPGLGGGGQMLQDDFYDPELGISFRCPATNCFIRRFLEKDSQGNLQQFGIRVYSGAGLAKNEAFFTFARQYIVGGKKVGRVANDQLFNFLAAYFPNVSWKPSDKLNGIPAGYGFYRRDDRHFEEFVVADEEEGVAHSWFSFLPELKDDAYLAYQILFSLQLDLTAPEIQQASLASNEVMAGDNVVLTVEANDDLTGVDLVHTYQEDPVRRLADWKPQFLYSWFGYDLDHAPGIYSLAYAYPFTHAADRTLTPTKQGFTYTWKVPATAPAGPIKLAGLKVRDRFGHTTLLSLDPATNGRFRSQYRVLSGRVRPLMTLTARGFNVKRKNGAGDSAIPKVNSLAFTETEIGTSDQRQCLRVGFQDESSLVRLAFDFTLDGQTTYVPPAGCFHENYATYVRTTDQVEACFVLTPCFDQGGRSLLPRGSDLSLARLITFDEVGNRGEINPTTPNLAWPKFRIR